MNHYLVLDLREFESLALVMTVYRNHILQYSDGEDTYRGPS